MMRVEIHYYGELKGSWAKTGTVSLISKTVPEKQSFRKALNEELICKRVKM